MDPAIKTRYDINNLLLLFVCLQKLELPGGVYQCQYK